MCAGGMPFEVCTYVRVCHAVPSQWDLSTHSGPLQRLQRLSVAAEQLLFLGRDTSDVCFAQQTQFSSKHYSCMSWVAGHSGTSPELMTFANSVPDCVPVAQRQGDDEACKDCCLMRRLWCPQHSSVCGTQLSTRVPQWR